MTVRDAETVELLRDEPELLAIADAVVSTQRRRRRPVWRRALLAVAAALVATVVALAAPWEDDDAGGLITERALAALPARGPVLHLVLEHRLGTRVDLDTGRVSPTLARSESWYDEERALLRVRAHRGGSVVADSTMRDAADSFDAAMAAGFARAEELFREALSDGRARVVAEGRVRGRDVYWLETRPEAFGPPDDTRVAIDRNTYELVQFRAGASDEGSADYELTVLTFEYLPRREGMFGRPGPDTSMQGSGAAMTPIRLTRARTALGEEPALWAGAEVRGMRIGEVELLDVEVDSPGGGSVRGKALELTYGAGGLGPPQPDSVVVTQMLVDDPARSYLDSARTTPEGSVDLQSGMTGTDRTRFRRWTASLRHGKLLVQVEGPSRRVVLEVARGLRPIPVGAG